MLLHSKYSHEWRQQMSTGTLYDFYKSREWRQVRESIIHRYNGMCAVTGDRGDVVHHILPIDSNTVTQPQIALNPYNLILLSRSVHEKIHERKNSPCAEGFHFDSGGNVIPDTIPDSELVRLLKQVVQSKKFDRNVFDRIHTLAGA